jgi:exodeoxyribonuclease VII large subunit
MFLSQSEGAGSPPAIWTVTQLNQRAKELLERNLGAVQVAAEISNYRLDRSGHRYFSLKDPGGVLPAALFRQRAMGLGFEPKDGMQVMARGTITVYGPSGRYQMMVSQLLPQGEGALQAAFLALKAKLGQEGLFDAARKRALPVLPRRIAVITSPTGSVWRDIVEVGGRRFPNVPLLLVPSRTQGAECAQEVVAALSRVGQHAARLGIDVVIVARGGGSLEDLWGFNDEAVARAIVACPVPVVSAVGHETDFTIADYVADVRAPTPSAAAELTVPRRMELVTQLASLRGRMLQAVGRQLRHDRVRLRALAAELGDGRRLLWHHTQRLAGADTKVGHAMRRTLGKERAVWAQLQRRLAMLHPRLQLSQQRAAMSRVHAAMVHGMRGVLAHKERHLARTVPDARGQKHRLAAARARLAEVTARMEALSPLAVLQRGYAIVTTPQGQVVRRQSDLAPQDLVDLRLHDGRIQARIEPS